eukprot:jgi/Tetstr1/446281/TSEL_033825.t1
MADLVSRAKTIVITKKTRAEVPLFMVFAAQSVETMVAHAAKSQPADLRVYSSEDDARKDRTGITDPSSVAGAASSSSTRSRAGTDTITVGRPDAKSRKLMAASSTAQPPGVVKTLTAAVLPPDAPRAAPPTPN